MEHIPQNDHILIVDDEPANVAVIEAILRKNGFSNYTSTTDPRQTLQLIEQIDPDLLILDLMMPHMDGFEVMAAVEAVTPDSTYFPILVMTADATKETKRRALASGATDFLTKPVDAIEAILRVKILLQTRWLQRQITDQNVSLEETVRKRTVELEAARIEILERLSLVAEFRDDTTNEHTERVGEMAGLLARALGQSDEEVQLIRRAAPLHDIGKVYVADGILLKPERLSEEEFSTMKMHTEVGARILSGSQVPLLQLAEEIAISHHERWDGTGYPNGLKEDEIPLSGRILAVVDTFDALTHSRPYKQAWAFEDAFAEIKAQAGKHFDPDVVSAFVTVMEQMTATHDHPVTHITLVDETPDQVIDLQRQEAV
jgi:putative two-component system response regulator